MPGGRKRKKGGERKGEVKESGVNFVVRKKGGRVKGEVAKRTRKGQGKWEGVKRGTTGKTQGKEGA